MKYKIWERRKYEEIKNIASYEEKMANIFDYLDWRDISLEK